MNLLIGFHRRVRADLRGILDHYENEAGAKVADELYEELQVRVNIVSENPAFYPRYHGEIRRANLKRFPYHFLYEIRTDSVWIFVLRHDSRNPSYGMRRL